MTRALLSFGLALSAVPALAEYRVYQYLVRPKLESSLVTAMDARVQRSTLNPVSFVAYHGGALAVDATLLRSWMCPGSTARRDFCPHPADREAPNE